MTEKTSTKEPQKKATPKEAKPVSLDDIQQELVALRQIVEEHSAQIVQLQEIFARKRRPVASNGKVQIKDTKTGQLYPSKNNCYQSLLKAGELKELVDAGVFGPVPEKNTFGWYTLNRAMPDRFQEVKPEQNGKS